MYKDQIDFKDQMPIELNHHISTNWSMDMPHYHNIYELNLSVSGGNRFFINGYIHEAQSGDLFFFTEEDVHKNIVPKGLEYDRYILLFDPLIIRNFIRHSTYIEAEDLLYLFSESTQSLHNKLSLSDDQLADFIVLLDTYIAMSKTDFKNHPIYLQTKLIEVLLFLGNIGKKNANPLATSKNTSSQIHTILKYIDHHLSQKLSIAHLAEHFYINKSYLCELFKKETGFTINQYITAKRLVLSKKLLTEGYSVTDVTEKVSFKNDAYFIRLFKQHTGTTPKQYAIKARQSS